MLNGYGVLILRMIYKLRVLDIDNDFFESYIFEDNEPDDNSEIDVAISWRMSIEEAIEENRSLIGEPVQ